MTSRGARRRDAHAYRDIASAQVRLAELGQELDAQVKDYIAQRVQVAEAFFRLARQHEAATDAAAWTRDLEAVLRAAMDVETWGDRIQRNVDQFKAALRESAASIEGMETQQ